MANGQFPCSKPALAEVFDGLHAIEIAVFERAAFAGQEVGRVDIKSIKVRAGRAAQPVDRQPAIFARHRQRSQDRRCFGPGIKCGIGRSEEHTSELQSLLRISYAVFCLKKKKTAWPRRNPER